MTPALHTELWTSWASMLRSYAAAHGLGAAEHAIVEVSPASIILRVGNRWQHFTPDAITRSDGTAVSFALHEDGTVRVGETTDEMDMAAEQLARELFAAG